MRRLPRAAAVAWLLLSGTRLAVAQDTSPGALVSGTVRQLLLDPTTYAPMVVAWEATRLDWRSSQTFFERGWLEHNARFTVSGHDDDVAIGYAAGNRQILFDALANLQLSVLNNVTARVTERLLLPRYPTHRKLVRAIGWAERSVMASYLTYRLSAGHFQQWQENEQRARALGFD